MRYEHLQRIGYMANGVKSTGIIRRMLRTSTMLFHGILRSNESVHKTADRRRFLEQESGEEGPDLDALSQDEKGRS